MPTQTKASPKQIYLGTFAIACATLSIEILLTRILSVVTWYYLAYFAISLAMLGMTGGALAVYFAKDRFGGEKLRESLAKACLGFAWSIPVSLTLLCLVPILSAESSPSLMNFLALAVVSLACAVPFYFSGIAIAGVLTRSALPVGKVYASDLAGSAAACILVLLGLSLADPYSLILLSGALGAVAAGFYAKGRKKSWIDRASLATAIGLAVLACANLNNPHGIRPFFVKDKLETPESFYLERWNSFSRVSIGNRIYNSTAQLWGGSPKWTNPILTETNSLVIDGSAATWIRRGQSPSDLEHLRYDVTNIGYYLRRDTGRSCVIGVGGGRDVQSALAFGHADVVGVEVNPIFIELLNGEFKDFAGLGGNPRVHLVVDEARSYFTRHAEPCSTMQMSLIDTWASTAAGAFSLAENALYTQEAWKVFVGRLTDDGLFFVSRWYAPDNINEIARLLSLASATLFELGVERPADHIAMIGAYNIATLVLSKRAFTPEELATLRSKVAELQFTPMIVPGSDPASPLLQRVLHARSRQELDELSDGYALNISPPTDENPYFFNMLKLGNMSNGLAASNGVVGGNLRATQYLVNLIEVLLILAFATLLLPLWARGRHDLRALLRDRYFVAGAAYFALIGAGFMFVEVAMIQRLNIYLGHPIYSLAVLLFTLILSTGVGSYLTERVPLLLKTFGTLYPPLIAGAILGLRFLLSLVISSSITWDTPVKITVSVGLLFPVGMMMGICFPLGMRMVQDDKDEKGRQAPWFWALNGVFGVLSSCVAVLVSIYLGVSVSFYIAAACYVALTFCARTLVRRKANF